MGLYYRTREANSYLLNFKTQDLGKNNMFGRKIDLEMVIVLVTQGKVKLGGNCGKRGAQKWKS